MYIRSFFLVSFFSYPIFPLKLKKYKRLESRKKKKKKKKEKKKKKKRQEKKKKTKEDILNLSTQKVST